MTAGLGSAAIVTLFDELSDYLAAYGEIGRLFVVGGAAMALGYDRDRTTRDIDAVFQPYHAVSDAIRVIADRHDLSPDWLNDAVKVFNPAPDPNEVCVYSTDHLRVLIPSPEYLLAMKVHAARATRDAADIAVLWARLPWLTVDDVQVLHDRYFLDEPLTERQRRLIEAVGAHQIADTSDSEG